MNGVLTNRTAKLFSQGAVIGLCWIGCTHQIAPRFHGALFFKRHDNTRRARHEFRQTGEEWTLAMNGVKTFRLLTAHVDQLESTNLETAVDNSINDRSCVTRAHGVGLDDSES